MSTVVWFKLYLMWLLCFQKFLDFLCAFGFGGCSAAPINNTNIVLIF